jgi:thiamine biosynthesis protein ThiI
MTLLTNQSPKPDIATVNEPAPGDIIIDVRHPQEAADSPLILSSNEVISIPFFNLDAQLTKLDNVQSYLVYCDKGIMSRLQANIMRDHGFKNIRIMNQPKSG